MGLFEHDGHHVIRVDGRELMSTRHYASEERLAEVACAGLSGKRNVRVLIGGLGLGFTLRAALVALAKDAQVVVSELMPEIVLWNQNPAYGLAKVALEDTRTSLEMGDVALVIARQPGGFDAIMLDADNQTTAMNTQGNHGLYTQGGLAQVYAALKVEGCAVYWSAEKDPVLAKRMSRAGFKVEVQQVRSHHTSGGLHTLIVGRR